MPEPTKYYREDTCRISVQLGSNDFGLPGLWATAEGGDLEADSQKTRAGGMGKQKSVGGPASRTDMTATIQLSDVSAGVVDEFEAATGKGRMNVKVEWLDPEATLATVMPDPVHRQGSVKSVATPSVDINGSAVTFLSVVMDCDEAAV